MELEKTVEEISTKKEQNVDNVLEKKIKSELEMDQKNFLETTLGKVINTGLTIGIKALLPDFLEKPVIQIKDEIIKGNWRAEAKQINQQIKQEGESPAQILSQIKNLFQNRTIKNQISNIMDNVLKNMTKEKTISKEVCEILLKGKDVIMEKIDSSVDNSFEQQYKSLQKIEKASSSWQKHYQNQDFSKMQKEYQKIRQELSKVYPIEIIIKQARRIENIQTLLQNNGQQFDLSENQKKLVEILA